MLILTEHIDFLKQMKLNCAEMLPQVGSALFDFDFSNNTFYNHPLSKVDYIITNDFNFLIGRGHYKLNKKKNTLISAGVLKINKEGKICYLDNDSGHYNPNQKHLNTIYSYFKMCNMLSDDCIVNYINKDNQLLH